ncbi:MAG: class I SAM-dependent methyltransferase [Bacillota bacterium]|nr:class I SAM-dependent methyltransferase [Bacillota bacterium]
MEENRRIQNAYRLTGSNSFYDGMITCSTFPGRVVSRLVWDMTAEDAREYLSRALSGIPRGFSGRLLEVPVGTGVLTMPLYQSLPDAKIVCLDYSAEMLAQAQTKARRLGLEHVAFHQGDVGALPFKDESFDVVLSLNGFHAFPDKEAAGSETFRVLKRGGSFCGCFYVAGSCKRTDWFIRHIYQRLKFFTPPYENMESLAARLQRLYREVELSRVKGIAVFVCRKE